MDKKDGVPVGYKRELHVVTSIDGVETNSNVHYFLFFFLTRPQESLASDFTRLARICGGALKGKFWETGIYHIRYSYGIGVTSTEKPCYTL